MKRRGSFLLLLMLALTPSAAAQTADEPSRAPDVGGSSHVHGIEVLPTAGRPFTAVDTIKWTRKLADGTEYDMHLSALVARDGQGRIYREHHKFAPANSNKEATRTYFVVVDPVGHKRTFCDVVKRHCTVEEYWKHPSFILPPDGLLAKGTRYRDRETLGRDVMEGVDVVGTRETLITAAGVYGNREPIISTREFWYSPDLQINVSVIRNDPRLGVQFVRLADLSVGEPDQKLFLVPAGFTVERITTESKETAE
jgi:hypothetical protein